METLINKYTKLNNSFKKTFVFHIGFDAGFFSEYNNMIFAMLYCLENQIKFTLYSRDANFKYKNGWEDYFEPFCEERTENFHHKYNVRAMFNPIQIVKFCAKQKYPLKKWLANIVKSCIYTIKTNVYLLLKKYFQSKYDFHYLMFELWHHFRNEDFTNTNFLIPQLGINGNLQEACRVLVQLTWRYNAKTKNNVENLIKQLHLPANYIGLHIRSGDKIKEANLYQPLAYIEKASMYSNTENIFVLTDNYQIINEVKAQRQTVYTLCEENERGYFHADFGKNKPEQIRKSHEKLFASIDILSQSEIFVGTFSSNPGVYLGMRMDKIKIVAVDYDEWKMI